MSRLLYLAKKIPAGLGYGALYNHFALLSTKKISSNDVWVPLRYTVFAAGGDLQNLQTYAGGNTVAGGHLKSTSSVFWLTPNTGADDSFGFGLVGSGRRDPSTGLFSSIQQLGNYWTGAINVYNTTDGCIGSVFNSSAASDFCTNTVVYSLNRKTGCAVRLVRTSTSLTNGQSGTYVGNDGTTYRTICINGVEFLAENLKETKFRDGTAIPIEPDNTLWANAGVNLAVGDVLQGGIVAHIFTSSETGYVANSVSGIIVQTSDLSTGAVWGCSGTDVSGAAGTIIGTGLQNTIDIITGCTTAGIAAKLCNDLNDGTYSDWYLPSVNELGACLQVLYASSYGIPDEVYYWTSSETTTPTLYAYKNKHRASDNSVISVSAAKTDSTRVRAIRNFSVPLSGLMCYYENDILNA